MKDLDYEAIFSDKRVAIIGDVMLDRYITGSVDRMSPEAPVPVLLYKETTERLGGAANVALNTHELGSTPIICALVGEDSNGRRLEELMEEMGATTEYVVKSDERQTTVKTRLLGNNQQLLRLDDEAVGPISSNDTEAVLQRVKTMFESEVIDVVILQDYNKGLLTPQLIEFVLNTCNEKDIFVSVDPKFKNFFAYKKVDLFKPNLKEISEALGSSISADIEALEDAAQRLNQRMNTRNLMITLSSKGLYIKQDDKSGMKMPALSTEIVDVCGAGDAVLVVTTLMLLAGLGVEAVGHVANNAGRIVCQKVGVAPVSLKELKLFD